ncbi:MAG: YebC/PmpR family DNA-binding transcriptional regulator [Candidatus Paceibacteria bacterium]
MAGHSKWAQIKYRKALTDLKKSKIFSKVSSLIAAAAKKGTDPTSNLALKEAILRAKEINMPQENIERAIKRGAGLLPGETIEEFLLEAYGPGGIALLLHVLTGNRNRAIADIRSILKDHGGKLAEPGSVAWLFKEVGRISIPDTAWNDSLEFELIEIGIEDIISEEGYKTIYIPKGKFDKIRNMLLQKEIPFESRIEFLAKNTIFIQDEKLKQNLESLFSLLDENENVEEIYSNATFQK